jgi:hypothetical protein
MTFSNQDALTTVSRAISIPEAKASSSVLWHQSSHHICSDHAVQGHHDLKYRDEALFYAMAG